MLDHSSPIDAFLTATAARQPTPGGGAISALAGALAASLGEMVLNYSVGKKQLAEFEPELVAAGAEMHRARQLLTELMVEDQAAYEALSAAKKLPEGAERRQTLAAALQTCLNVPQAVAATALAILNLCDRVAPKVNKYLYSDLAIAADLATATVRCSIHSIRINMADVADSAQRVKIEEANQQMLARALETIIRFSRRSM